MLNFINNSIKERRTAMYVRISTSHQQTDRQVIEFREFAEKNHVTVQEEDIYIDVISGFKEGEIRPQYSVLKQKASEGIYQQILFSEFSRLDRKPANLLKSIEFYQSHDVWLYFKKQDIWVRDKSDIATQIMISVLAVMSQYEIELFSPVVWTAELQLSRTGASTMADLLHMAMLRHQQTRSS